MTSFVYFIKPTGEKGPLKIGCSIKPQERFANIALWSPVRLELVAYAPGKFIHENALHHLFKADKVHGEWFAYSPQLWAIVTHVFNTGQLPPLELRDERKLKSDEPQKWNAPELIAHIHAFCDTNNLPVSRFGEQALNDSAFVHKLEKGRRVWPETEAKAREFMQHYHAENGA